MGSTEIRNASVQTLKQIIAGLVRDNVDNFSKQIAYGELERRGVIKPRF